MRANIDNRKHALITSVLSVGAAWPDNDRAAWRPWPGAIIYKLHVGTFTDEGTYADATAIG
jgi:1,4-alpha-glucan branching enzyme